MTLTWLHFVCQHSEFRRIHPPIDY